MTFDTTIPGKLKWGFLGISYLHVDSGSVPERQYYRILYISNNCSLTRVCSPEFAREFAPISGTAGLGVLNSSLIYIINTFLFSFKIKPMCCLNRSAFWSFFPLRLIFFSWSLRQPITFSSGEEFHRLRLKYDEHTEPSHFQRSLRNNRFFRFCGVYRTDRSPCFDDEIP